MIDYPPTRTKILQTFDESEMGDWHYEEPNRSLASGDDSYHNPVWVYDFDVNLRIERGRVAVENFHQDWIDEYPDTSAKSYGFWLYYGQSPIQRKLLVAVDGYRAWVPIPDDADGQLTISKTDAKYGRIVTRDYQSFKESLKYADIEII